MQALRTPRFGGMRMVSRSNRSAIATKRLPRRKSRVDLARKACASKGKENSRKEDGPDYFGTFFLVFANASVYLLDHFVRWSSIKAMYLNHSCWKWWQIVTSTFCHASWEHLSGNLFLLYIFGRLVEEEEGALGVLMAYLVCGSVASACSLILLPASMNSGPFGIGGSSVVSIGASGAVFGLFAVSVMVKLMKGFSLKKVLEVGILGQFVVEKLIHEFRIQAKGGTVLAGTSVNHIAHISGALAGVLLILLLSRLPQEQEANDPRKDQVENTNLRIRS